MGASPFPKQETLGERLLSAGRPGFGTDFHIDRHSIMRRLPLLFLALVVSVGLVAVGCDSTGSMVDDGEGTVELRLTGASASKALTAAAVADSGDSSTVGNVDSAAVTITRTVIVAQGDSADGDSLVVLTEEDLTVDLMDLQSGLDTLMAEVALSQGTYEQLRMITADEATVRFDDGAEEQVMVASGQQTGFKVNFSPFTIDSPGDHVQITLQWDVENSLKGNRNGNLVITPAIEASVDTSGASS